MEHRVDRGASAGVVGQRNSREAFAVGGNVGVFGEFVARIQREGHTAGLEKCYAFGVGHGSPPSEALVEFTAAL